MLRKIVADWEFPGGLVVRILGFHCRVSGSIPDLRTEILQDLQVWPKKITDCAGHYSKHFTCMISFGIDYCIKMQKSVFAE